MAPAPKVECSFPTELYSHPSLAPDVGHTLSKQKMMPEIHGGREAMSLQRKMRQIVSKALVQILPLLPVPELSVGRRGRGSREPSLLLQPKVMDKVWGRHLSARFTFSFYYHLLCPWQPLLSLASLQDPQDKSHPPEDSSVLGVRVMTYTRPGLCRLTVLPLPSLLGHWL